MINQFKYLTSFFVETTIECCVEIIKINLKFTVTVVYFTYSNHVLFTKGVAVLYEGHDSGHEFKPSVFIYPIIQN